MKRFRGALPILIAALLVPACSAEDDSVTEQDAVALGMRSLRCPQFGLVPIYAARSYNAIQPSSETLCAALVHSLDLIAEDGIVSPGTVTTDSLVVAIIGFDRYGDLPGRPGSFYFDTTIDLANRSSNIRVVEPGIDESVEISWAPEGLRY